MGILVNNNLFDNIVGDNSIDKLIKTKNDLQ